MKESQTMLGRNRTGAALAPELLEEMIEGTEEFPPTGVGDAEAIGEVRASYTEIGDPIGTMPPPAGVAAMVKTVAQAVTGAAPVQLLDKLGERLAFERAGTRLWQALVAKFDATGGFEGGPTRDQIAHIRDEELRHFEMLRTCLLDMEGDPTAITPAAEVQSVASKGLPAVLTDPRTDLVQCLEAVLTAELVDNDCWPALIELLSEAGYEEQAQEFLCAVASEREHLQCVRMWLAAAHGRSVDAVRDLSMAETETVMAMPAIAALTVAEDEDAEDDDVEDEDAEDDESADAELEMADDGDDAEDLTIPPLGAATRGRGTAKQTSAKPAGGKSRTRDKKRKTSSAKAGGRGRRSR